MADKNLHDIKIDDLDNPPKTPLKNILTLLALLFIILVISVAITRLILNTDEDETLVDGNSTSSAIVETTSGEANTDSSAVATTAGIAAAAAAGSMLANGTPLKERNVSTNTTHNTSKDSVKENNNAKDKDSGSKTKVTLREHQPVKAKEPAPKKHTVKHVVKKSPTHHTSSKQYVDKVVSSSTKKTASHGRSIEGQKRPGHYIKVGTFKDTSTAVAKIKKTGLNYILVKPKNDKTTTRVLIGPFKSKWGAKQHLPSVQHNIAEGAYITRID